MFLFRRFLGLPALGLASALVLSALACGDDSSPGAFPAGEGGVDPVTADGDTPGADATPPEPSAGCGPADVKKGFLGSQSITVAGSKRTYELFVPDTYDNQKSFPVVFVFHGDGGNGANLRGYFNMETEAAGGAIFVYPDGEDQTWHFDDAAGLSRDVGFIDAVVADLGKTHCIDKKRLFMVGFSRGAYFANMLTCVSKSNVRAVVAHSGGGPFGVDGIGTSYDNDGKLICPSPPAASLQIIGDADGLLGDAKQARDYWERVNKCQTSSKAYAPSPCIAYDACSADRPEIYCEIPGLGHEIWSSAPKTIWGFLKTK